MCTRTPNAMARLSNRLAAILILTAKSMALKNPKGAHAGDMPINLQVMADGTDHVSFVTQSISLKKDAKNSVFANGGTAFVIHEKADDMMTDPTGNAGARIACGVVTAP